MKTLNDVKVGDELYQCYPGRTSITPYLVSETIEKLKDDTIKVYKYGGSISGKSSATYIKIVSSDGKTVQYYYFVNEIHAKRYAKAQMIKELNFLINQAKSYIQKVKDYRQENWEFLNHEYTDKHLNCLEKELI